MATKTQTQNKFEGILKNLKILYSFDFIDETSFNRFLEQIAESLQKASTTETKKDKEIKTTNLGEEARKAKDKAIKNKLLLFGSLYY